MFRDSSLMDDLKLNLLRLPLMIGVLALLIFLSDFNGYGPVFGQNGLTAGVVVAMLILTRVTFPAYTQLAKRLSFQRREHC
ncbi:hypothetical protein K0504_12505 [Neiella marina]|uniref:Uncharacterized protein n=1 Tax=Neiella holothuriorum TaxID=2870530 RepID=A0ABS7EHN2_9GAMM|nr:hypothetical protein [Neiella holothuriorum]MBW8191859.1 hypothetical protein [Neiella holothuriorum]